MRELLKDYLTGQLSRRGFIRGLVATGLTAAAARKIVDAAEVDESPGDGGGRMVVAGTGGDLLVEQLRAAGTRFIFTNPGSFEVGFFDALTDRTDLQVIVGLHEGVVIPMADAYHKVTGQPSFVNVHAIAGTAQMAGQLYNSHRDGSAVVVTAGMRDATVFSDDVTLAPQQGFSQCDVNRQFTKISWDVRTGESGPVSLRRAYKTAAAAPGGPVYVAYASHALEKPNLKADIWPREKFLIRARPRPAKDKIEKLARWLIQAERPMPIFGDEVWKSGGQDDAIELCELLGMPGATGTQAFHNFPTSHPLYVGRFSNSRPYPFGNADLVIQFGTRDWGGLTIPKSSRVNPGARFVAIGIDTNMLGRTQPMDLAIVADVRETCRDLVAALKSMATEARLKKIRDVRAATVIAAVAQSQARRLQSAKKSFGQTPIHPDRLGYELEQALDRDAILVAENLTGRHNLLSLGYRENEKMWLSNSGHSLGWGIGAAVGAKLGAPNRQVVASMGDGATMYSASGFWTMKRYGVPVLIVVWNNHNYQTVRNSYYRYNGRMRATGHYHGMYLGDPDIDFVKLSESQGVRGEKVTAAGDIQGALKRGIQATRDGNPYLVEAVISRVGGGAESTWHENFNLAAERTRKV